MFFVLNLFIWGERSTGAVPFTTLIILLLMWFGVSVPLVFLGSFLGYKRPAVEFPTKTNLIPRAVPTQPWYMTPAFSILVGGILPFGAVFIELFFILSSIWLHQACTNPHDHRRQLPASTPPRSLHPAAAALSFFFHHGRMLAALADFACGAHSLRFLSQYYYVFGFLLLVLVILIITCAEITIVMCYFQVTPTHRLLFSPSRVWTLRLSVHHPTARHVAQRSSPSVAAPLPHPIPRVPSIHPRPVQSHPIRYRPAPSYPVLSHPICSVPFRSHPVRFQPI